MRTLTMLFTLALTVLLVSSQFAPRACAGDKEIDVAGEWLAEGNADRPCAVFRHGHVLLLVNDVGSLGTGRLDDEGRVVVVLKGEGWDAGLKAKVHDEGRLLKWSNGTVWKRR